MPASVPQLPVVSERPEGVTSGLSEARRLRAPQRVGLATASSPVPTGWWTRLTGRRTHKERVSGRISWWTWRWRRRAAAGVGAAPEPQAERVWLAGDALVGPSTVAGAMAQGKAAAAGVLETLGGHPGEDERRLEPARNGF